MSNITRRRFLELAGAAGMLAGLPAFAWPLGAKAKSKARVVIVGGGFGGATCAKYLRRFDAGLDITLIERERRFYTCPFSNMVLGGTLELDAIAHDYNGLREKHKITILHDEVVGGDPVAHSLQLSSGRTLAYDKLVVSPGIDFQWDALEGYDEAGAKLIPHAWKAGEQTRILRTQLTAMKDGGLVVIAPPGNPFRCPPGPYERASMIAHYLQQHKPKSKILILDAKDKFSKQPLFTQGWNDLYKGMIEWVKASDGGRLQGVDVAKRTLISELGDKHKADVINLIPPQKAGALAHALHLTNNDGWCPVNQKTFESLVHKDVHVIGDASVAGKMPKSGFSANSQGKVCAAAIAAGLQGVELPDTSYVNTCYSLVAPNYGISVAAVYRHDGNSIVKVTGAGGVSPKDADAAFRKQEADYARGWYDSITADAFG